MNIVAIIPARYKSTRLEGKSLIDIHGKTMIQRVYEQAQKAIQNIFVATDDKRIEEEVIKFGGNVVMTSTKHITGTNRCLEAVEKIEKKTQKTIDIIINVQGDEPMLHHEQIKSIINCFEYKNTTVATLITKVLRIEDLKNKGEVFVTFDKNMFALYFSRSIIPYVQNEEKIENWLKINTFYKHIGLYGYTKNALQKFAQLPQTLLEQTESLEQLRWLEEGEKIKLAITPHDSVPVDTLQDLKRVRELINKI